MTIRTPLFTMAICAAALFSSCGGGDESLGDSGPADQGGNVRCDAAGDCDDDVTCTVDSCSASGNCLHTPMSLLCPNNGVCHPTEGCMAGRICGSPSECADSDPCTQDETCNPVSATCSFSALDNDGDDEVPLVCGGTDCNDATASVGSGKNEICGNAIDDNCNGVTDADATVDSDFTLRYDENDCGTCGNTCSNGTTCYQGECVACGSTGAPCCNATCSASHCVAGTCANGGECVTSGASATCAAACGARGEPCCAGNTCDLGSTCGAGNLCRDPAVVDCSDAGTEVSYRLNMLSVPTPEQANAGDPLGHNVDGVGDTCGIPDYAGGVDNSWIDLFAALPALTPDDPFDLQGEINTALACSNANTACTRLDLIVHIRTGTGCVTVEIEDGAGNNLAGPFNATLDGSGNFRGTVNAFSLPIPFGPDSGAVTIDFALSRVIISGTVAGSALSNVVIGGALPRATFDQSFENLLPFIHPDIEWADVEPILDNLTDIQVGGSCTALSLGLVAAGTQLP